MSLPVGLVYDPAGKVVLDPDTGVQRALRHLFDTFERTSSARAVVHAFTQRRAAVPGQDPHRRAQGRVGVDAAASLARAAHPAQPALCRRVRRMAANATARPRTGRSASSELPREQWTALIPDAHPGYITFEQFEPNQDALLSNAPSARQRATRRPPREGAALLQGLAICGRCGQRMTVRYHHRGGVLVPDYQCMGEAIQAAPAAAACGPGPRRWTGDRGKLLLDTVTPARARSRAQRRRQSSKPRATRPTSSAKPRRARPPRAELARRRYLAVDPDNRLVANTLEADWNESCAPSRRPRRVRTRTTAAADAQRRAAQEGMAARIRLPATVERSRNPATRAQTHRRLLIEDVTLNRDQHIHRARRLRGGQTHHAHDAAPPPRLASPPDQSRHVQADRPAARRSHRRPDRRQLNQPDDEPAPDSHSPP